MNIWYEELKILVDSGLSTQQIANKLGIAKTSVMYRLKKCGLQTIYASREDNKSSCLTCKVPLKGNQTHFCTRKCKALFYKESNYSKSYECQQTRGKSRRLLLIKQAGNKCIECGYDKNNSVLVFHHLDPTSKKFNIDMRRCSNTNMDSLLEEANKCILLCANCHTALHNPNYDNY